LRALADEIAVAGGVRPLVIVVDLQRSDATHLIGEALAAQGADPQFMANNAGFGWIGTAAALDRDEQLAMIDVNVRMLTEGRSPLSTAWRAIVRGPQCRLRGGLPARAGHDCLLCHQGLCAVVQRGATQRAQIVWAAGDHALPGPGTDRIRGARRPFQEHGPGHC
jgi:hypothetical protein